MRKLLSLPFRSRALVLTMMLSLNCVAFGQQKLAVCNKSSIPHMLTTHSKQVFVDGNDFITVNEVVVNGVTYFIHVNKSSIIDLIITSDIKFRTSDVGVGMSYKEIRHRIISGSHKSGWGYTAQLSSGWTAVFSDRKVIEERKISADSRVEFFFMRCANA